MNNFKRVNKCRICGSSSLVDFLNLGEHPPSDAFLTKQQLSKPEPKYPLEVCFCESCNLVQLRQEVSPDILFKDNYPYMTSISKSMQSHVKNLVTSATEGFNLKKGSLVVDVGSNDGTLLEYFQDLKMNVLGVDPSNIAEIANDRGVETLKEYFSSEIAKIILNKYGSAQLITGLNVFAHIGDLHDFLKGINIVLDKNGVLILEFPYLIDLIEKVEFDTIYHEHLSYFSIKPLTVLFGLFNMEIFDIIRTSVHGGSIRIFVKKLNSKHITTSKSKEMLALEKEEKLDSIKTYHNFEKRVQKLKIDLVSLLKELKLQGKVIAGDGAPAKGNTLLNYCEIGTDILDYIVEMSPLKHNLYTPGTHIPIYPINKIYSDKPDYLLILPWNIKKDIIQQQSKFAKNGGKFIVPVPRPEVY